MSVRTPLLLAAAAALTQLTCTTTDPNALRVISTFPEGILPRSAELAFTFSRRVVPVESTNVWTPTPYIAFSPPIPGAFVWQDTARLVFSPDGGFPGDARVRGRLNRALLVALSGAPTFTGDEEFQFATESFTLRKAEFFYDRIGTGRTVGVRANLEFSYTVNPADVPGTLRITMDGQEIRPQAVMTKTPSRLIAVEIGPAQQTDRPREIRISVDNALVSPETETHISMERPLILTLPALEDMKIYGHEFGTDGASGWIRIRTSQEVDVSTAKRFLALTPERDYTVEADGAALMLRGPFGPGTNLHLTVKQGLESILGGATTNDYDADIIMGNLAPSFGFASQTGVYMLLAGRRTLALKTVNLPRLFVRVSQVFQNNLLYFLEQGRYYDYDWMGDEDGGMPSTARYRYFVGNFGRRIEEDTIATGDAINSEVTTDLPLERYMQTGYRGFYVVEIADPARQWRTTSKLVSVSNIGLIVKQSAGELLVFATSLETTQPMSGVRISLISTTNQTMAVQNTDGQGVARFDAFREMSRDFTLKLITAELENDFNFINLADYRVETSRFPVDGKRDAATQYEAMLYGDRNIYRPGEKIIVSGLLRDLQGGRTAGIPVHLRLLNPRGTVLNEQQHLLNEEGSFETSYQTQPSAPSGTYRFELSTGNRLYLTDYEVSVEDFVPDRLRITLTPSADRASPGEQIAYALQAFNFFGPPAAGRRWEFEGTFQIVPFVSRAFPEFRFRDDAAKDYSSTPEVHEGTTDQDGRAAITFRLPGDLTSTGILRARARAAVFDESGRPVYQMAQTTIHPRAYYLGVRRAGAYYVSPNIPQSLQIVAVDRDDAPLKGFRARVSLLRREWHSVLRQSQGTGTLRYVSERREIPVREETVTINGAPLQYSYTVPRSGDYVLRVAKEGDTGYNEFSFSSYSWGTSDLTSFPVDPEARVEIIPDRKVYAPGDRARVLFQAPFSGRMLVTIERNRVFSYRYLDVVDNAASMEFPVEETFLPNVYVSAVLFRGAGERNIPLLAGHGVAPLIVEKPSNRLTVSISAPAKIRPKSRQTITVGAGGERDVFVTLAAVDEGICQVKNYTTPDPYAYFYAKRALETQTFDFFKHLIAEPDRGAGSSPGGSDDESAARRVNPLGVQRFKPLALWSGILRTGAQGTVAVPLAIPEFSGEVRLMAFAYKGGRFGAAQQAMKVADPVILTPGLPRFLTPGDSIQMQITAFNTTAKEAALSLQITATGGLTLPVKSATLNVGPNQERFLRIPLKATGAIGPARVTLSTTAFGEKIESVTELPVRPAAPLTADAVSGFIEGGATMTRNIEDVYLPYNRKGYLALSPFPVVNLAPRLKHLLGYPHGCLEQTVSKAFPQIYLRDVAALLAPEILSSGSPAYFVQEAITKIASLQTPAGDFLYWPEGGYTNDWTTVYATHFLLEAKRAGYAVPEAVLKSALAAVGAIARGKKTEDSYSSGSGKITARRIASKSVLYGLFVLAVAGAPEKAVMNFYRIEKSLLTEDTRMLLASAFALSGDRKTYTEILPSAFEPEDARRTTGGNFDSPVRSAALMLYVMLETDLNNPSIGRAITYLSSLYREPGWYSTQDDAFALLAFGRAARMTSAGKAEGTITLGSRQVAYEGETMKVDLKDVGGTVSVTTRGSARTYYSLVTEGIRKDGKVKIEDRNILVRREFLDRNGGAVSLSGIRQNALIVVRLTLRASVDALDHIAITDLLPAGFEIDNPRISETTTYAFIKNQATPRYLDLRDDRINLYTDIANGKREQVFYYIARAVTPGVFRYPAVVAETMYSGEYYSANGETRVVIE